MRTPSRADRVVVVGSVLAVTLLVTCAMISPFLAAFAIAGLVMLAMLLAFNVERTALMVMTAAMFMAPLNKLKLIQTGGGGGTVSDFMVLLAIALLVPVLIRSRIRLPAAFVAGSVVLMATGLTATAASEAPSYSLNLMLRLTVVALGLPIIFMWWRPNLRILSVLGFAYVLGSTASVVYALAIGADIQGRYQGLTVHPNYLGISSTLALCLLPFLLKTMSQRARFALYACGLACLGGVWLSGSRAALVVVLAIAVAFPVLERSLRAAGLLLAGITAGLALSDRLLAEEGSNALGRLLGGGAASAADDARREALSKSWAAFQEHPILGNGFSQVLEGHNIFLGVAVATGVIGLVGFGWLIWPALALLLREPGAIHSLGYPPLAYLLLGVVQPNLWDRMIWVVLALSYVAVLAPAIRPRGGAATAASGADPMRQQHRLSQRPS